jgi:CIC family chloride channel protein
MKSLLNSFLRRWPLAWSKSTPSAAAQIARDCLLGLAAGLGAVLFQILTDRMFNNSIGAFARHGTAVFLIGSFATIVTASLICGWLIAKVCPEAAGSGIPQLKTAFWKDFGYVPWRVAAVKFTGGVLSIGGGLSLGREGPSVQLGGGLSSGLSGLFGLPKQQRREACAAGAAAGLAAAFNTPLGAITFVLEEIIGDMNSRVLSAVVLAGIMGAFAVHALNGPQPAFALSITEEARWVGYLAAPVVAALAALVGVAFQVLTLGVRRRCRGWSRLPLWLRPTVGGIGVWVLGVAVWLWSGRLGVFGLGYQDLSEVLRGNFPWLLALALLGAKFFATVLAYGTGGLGGIFAPSLFLGAMVGATISGVIAPWVHVGAGDQTLLMLVGMCAALGALVRAPITSILILFEMTHDFSVVPGLMLATLISQAVARALAKHNFYDAALEQDGVHLEHLVPPRDLRRWRQTPVAVVASFRPVVVEAIEPTALRALLADRPYQCFPVKRDGRVIGVATRRRIEEAAACGGQPVLAAVRWISPKATVCEAEQALLDSPENFLCLGDAATGELVGVLTLHDLLRGIQEADAEL